MSNLQSSFSLLSASGPILQLYKGLTFFWNSSHNSNLQCFWKYRILCLNSTLTKWLQTTWTDTIFKRLLLNRMQQRWTNFSHLVWWLKDMMKTVILLQKHSWQVWLSIEKIFTGLQLIFSLPILGNTGGECNRQQKGRMGMWRVYNLSRVWNDALLQM